MAQRCRIELLLLLTTACIVTTGCQRSEKEQKSAAVNKEIDEQAAHLAMDKTLRFSYPARTGSMGGDTTVSDSELGIALYPRSTPKAGASYKLYTTEEDTLSSVRTSSDSPEKIADFYAPKVRDVATTPVQVMGAAGMIVAGKLSDSKSIVVSAVRDETNPVTQIAIVVKMKKT